MTEPHVITALRSKRAELAGHIRDHEHRIKALRERLAHIDATIRIFSPTLDPETIEPRKTLKRSRHFKHGELARLVLSALRTAPEPMTAVEITRAVLTAKRHPMDDHWIFKSANRCVVAYLRKLRLAGEAETLGKATQNPPWRLTSAGD